MNKLGYSDKKLDEKKFVAYLYNTDGLCVDQIWVFANTIKQARAKVEASPEFKKSDVDYHEVSPTE